MDKEKASIAPRIIGEFFVIVLGVLVALAADRWNQDRVDAEAAVEYRARIISELTADSARLTEEMQAATRSIQGGLVLLDLVTGMASSQDVMPLYFQCVRSTPLPYAGGATLDELRSTGRLGLLPPEVRQGLFDYYGFVEGQLLRMQDIRRIGRDPITEMAFRTGAWLPRERISEEEALARFRSYPGAEEAVNSCIALQRTSAGVLRQWLSSLSDALENIRTW